MLSVIIPSRNDQFLQKTINDLLSNARGEIEVIVVLDGYWPEPALIDDPRVRILHQGSVHQNYGMREAINSGVAMSRGEYIMKIDEHCMVDEGFDVKLAEDCEDMWVVVPRRYRLDAENWKLIEDNRPPVDYMFLAYPYERPQDKTCGLHGAEWRELARAREHILIDDLMSWQGSCYFMKRTTWDWLGPLDSEKYGWFTQEAQEIGNKIWLGGGRLVVNKKTWYAHFHKGKTGKAYGFSGAQWDKHAENNERGRKFCIDYWINDRWPERVHDFDWLLAKFAPVPTWPENWREQILIDKQKEQ